MAMVLNEHLALGKLQKSAIRIVCWVREVHKKRALFNDTCMCLTNAAVFAHETERPRRNTFGAVVRHQGYTSDEKSIQQTKDQATNWMDSQVWHVRFKKALWKIESRPAAGWSKVEDCRKQAGGRQPHPK